MKGRRVQRINSLLREVIADVLRDEVKNPHVPPLLTVTRVEVSDDLQQAKVFVTLFGDGREEALRALQSAAGFIGVKASKEVRLRFFPVLRFLFDTEAESQMHIQSVIDTLQREREQRESGRTTDGD